MSLLTTFRRWLGVGQTLGPAGNGAQYAAPGVQLAENLRAANPELALQLSAVWGCVDLLTRTISTLPLFVYTNNLGRRDVARTSLLWALLHDSPNEWMTPAEFWRVVLLNRLFRGNGYARIDRNAAGDAVALWPMSADQTTPYVLDDGRLVYEYRLGNDVAVLAAENVLHIKGLGNGIVGLPQLDYMRATITEGTHAQEQATRIFRNGDKPAGLLMVDRVLNTEQRAAIRANFSHMADGSVTRLHVLEAGFKYEPISMTPADAQLLQTRQFTVEEIARWFGVPAVLLNHANVTTWGSGIEQILDGFYKLTIRPAITEIEQAVTKRVLTSGQKARYTVEFGFDALLRGNTEARYRVHAIAVQNGLATRNEARQYENLPPLPGGDLLTAQTNLAPVEMLGQAPQGATNAGTQEPLAQ